MPEFLTPKQIATALGLDYRSILREIEDGKLPAYKVRSRIRVKREDYETWLSRNAVQPSVVEPWDFRPDPAARSLDEVGILRA